ncbi:unnamed protein product [Lupinus luteus]|uniref:Uncharacterized protein n=1 Tax=Lupinus luteus TaxID=3873 RepID=A0AAV1XFP8_LUPLU
MSSMSSWTILLLMFVLALVTWVPASAKESPLEHCLRRIINPSSSLSSPPPTTKVYQWFDVHRYVCNDQFRVVEHYVRLTGKFPTNYLKALCNILGNNDQKVKHYLKGGIFIQGYQGLIAGRTCATI